MNFLELYLNENNNASYSKLSKELKNGIEILVGQAVFMDQNSQNVIWINKSRTA